MSRSARLLAASRPAPPVYLFAADLGAAAVAPLLADSGPEAGVVRPHHDYELLGVLAALLWGVLPSLRIRPQHLAGLLVARVCPAITAVVTAVSSASFVAFTFDRMEAVSRAEPLLHGALLLCGLVLIRVVARQVERSKRLPRACRTPDYSPV